MVDVEAPRICTLADRGWAFAGVHLQAIPNLKPVLASACVHPHASAMGPEPLACAPPDPGLPMPHVAVIGAW